jgi:hypothetical protein
MIIKKILTNCIENCRCPLLFFGLILVLIAASKFINNQVIDTTSFVFLGISLIGLVISTIYQLKKRSWFKAIFTGLLIFGTIVAIVFYAAFTYFIETIDGDKWADQLKIPTNIQLNIPIDRSVNNQKKYSVLASTKSKTDFQLYNSFQPGLYEFDFWTGKIESGTIYLKAFEITKGQALSTDRLPKQSAIKIYNSTDRIFKFSSTSDFTIYEGDWGKPYAARFEVWFKPDNGLHERKLFMKNYKIEGWQR